MKIIKNIVLIFIFGLINCPVNAESKTERAALDLIQRILPEDYKNFKVEIIQKDSAENDRFEIENVGEQIVLRGTNGVAVASALNYYLKNYTNCQISWNSSNLKLPKILPEIPTIIKKETPYTYRYYFNYCTFNYSMSWWNWERWEKEIDFMALNGINFPLALTGQNSIWERVYKKLGFTDDDLTTFFSGPAYFNWFWMGNLDGWGGPLPKGFMKKQEELQMKILERERSLGMKPILPAFTGHVPPKFKEKFPNSKVRETQWVDFPPVYVLDPEDPMFEQIGTEFLKETIKTFGTSHYYSSDTFNENKPPTNDSLYLNGISEKIFSAMIHADPEAKWVMQGWIFVYSGRAFWGETQTKALLNAIPDDRLIVLDLWAECRPAWLNKNAFYNKQWLWCMLNNFGGNNLMYGRMDEIASGPYKALHHPESGRMKGIGLTPEAIEQNPVIYEMMLDHVWRTDSIKINQWLHDYVKRRYGQTNDKVNEAWNILYKTVYSGGKEHGGPTASIIAGRPTFDKNNNWTDTYKSYETKDLIKAWKLLMDNAELLQKSDGFRYDLIDLTRQVLANYADSVQRILSKTYQKKDFITYKINADEFLQIIQDMDKVLATRKEWLLGTWINAAKKWGDTEEESKLYERNAKNLITTWGGKDSKIHDYSWRLWSGMLKDFYFCRWKFFFDYLDVCQQKGIMPNMEKIDQQIKNWEWNWVNTSSSYSDVPKGNQMRESKLIYSKYYNKIMRFFNEK